jgi:agmatinase
VTRYLEAKAPSLTDRHNEKLLLGVPYDGAVSFRKGAKKGPWAIRYFSESIESYSPYQKRDLKDLAFVDKGNLRLNGQKQKARLKLSHLAEEAAKNRQQVYTLGGDHSVILGVVEGLLKVYPALDIVYLDAHCDLREAYDNDPYSHACVLKNLRALPRVKGCFQIGTRSGTAEEFKQANILPCDDQGLQTLKGAVKNPVYVSLDFDFFDPAFVPAVGNPEPNGHTFSDFLLVLKYLKDLPLAGFDFVELAPDLDKSGRSAVLAAQTVREALLFS